MFVPVVKRSSAWILAGGLLAGCAAPTADWKPLRAQDSAQRERDYASCVPDRRWETFAWLVLFPAAGGSHAVGEMTATHRCMERAGYEWAGRSPRE